MSNNKYNWYGQTWSVGGCHEPDYPKGWYLGTQLLANTYLNPKTKKTWTPFELDELVNPGPVNPVYPNVTSVSTKGTDNSMWITIGIVVLLIAGAGVWYFTK